MGTSALVALPGQEAGSHELSALLALCGLGSRIVTHTAAPRAVQQHSPAVVIIRAVRSDDTAICRTLRALTPQPILAICPTHSEELVVGLLEAGADCVLAEPLSRRELSGRLSALLRQRQTSAGDQESGAYSYGDLSIDADGHRASVGERELTLTPTEFRILLALVRRAGSVVPHAALIREVWGRADAERPENLRLHVRSLRRKLADHREEQPVLVRNQRGIGYCLVAGPAVSREKAFAYG